MSPSEWWFDVRIAVLCWIGDTDPQVRWWVLVFPRWLRLFPPILGASARLPLFMDQCAAPEAGYIRHRLPQLRQLHHHSIAGCSWDLHIQRDRADCSEIHRCFMLRWLDDSCCINHTGLNDMVMFYTGLVTALNCYSVEWTLKAQNTFTVAKLAAIGLMICCGIYQLANGWIHRLISLDRLIWQSIRCNIILFLNCLFPGQTQHLARGFQGSSTSIGDLSTAFYGGLWSYDGW